MSLKCMTLKFKFQVTIERKKKVKRKEGKRTEMLQYYGKFKDFNIFLING